MEAKIVEKQSFKVVGVELSDANLRSHLILYAWTGLAPRLAQVKNQVRPEVLYGVWYRKPGVHNPSYLVGVEVWALQDVPAGMSACTIPDSRFVVMSHRGNIANIGDTYQAIMRWMGENNLQHNEAATFEVYDTTQRLSDDYQVMVYEPVK